MPGPPRAFMATARWKADPRDSPATAAPAQTLTSLTTHANTRNQQKNTRSRWRARSSLTPTIAK